MRRALGTSGALLGVLGLLLLAGLWWFGAPVREFSRVRRELMAVIRSQPVPTLSYTGEELFDQDFVQTRIERVRAEMDELLGRWPKPLALNVDDVMFDAPEALRQAKGLLSEARTRMAEGRLSEALDLAFRAQGQVALAQVVFEYRQLGRDLGSSEFFAGQRRVLESFQAQRSPLLDRVRLADARLASPDAVLVLSRVEQELLPTIERDWENELQRMQSALMVGNVVTLADASLGIASAERSFVMVDALLRLMEDSNIPRQESAVSPELRRAILEEVASIVKRVGTLVPEVNKADFTPEVAVARDALGAAVSFRDRGLAAAAWAAAHRAQAMLTLAIDPDLQPPDRTVAPSEDRKANLAKLVGQVRRIPTVRSEAIGVLQSASNRLVGLRDRGIPMYRVLGLEQEARSLATVDATILSSTRFSEEALLRLASTLRNYLYAKAQLQMIDDMLWFLEESVTSP